MSKNIIFLSFTSLIFLLWFCLIGYNLLDQPFIWDDLHLLRIYSKDEILSTWSGNWDPDNMETPSYRPIATLFYSLISFFFGESFVSIRIFTFILIILLIFSINILFSRLGLKKLEIIIFTVLIIFAKIFTTLLSFMALNALIFCYMCTFFSLNLFLKSLKKKNFNYYLISLFLAFLAIFSREELYILPFILFLISVKNLDFKLQNAIKVLLPIIPFFFLVVLHMYLRVKFVPEADSLSVTNEGLFFAGEILNFKKIIFTFFVSWLPMGFDLSVLLDGGKYFFRSINFFFVSIWISFLFFSIILLNYHSIKKIIFIKKILIFLLLSILSCAPAVAYIRAFGIFLPSVFALIIVSIILASLIETIQKNKKYIFPNLLRYLIVFLILFSGIIGGGIRSNEHIKAADHFSASILDIDSGTVYNDVSRLTIPEKRLKKKLKHLQDLNIYEKKNNIDQYKILSEKIKFPKYTLLDF